MATFFLGRNNFVHKNLWMSNNTYLPAGIMADKVAPRLFCAIDLNMGSFIGVRRTADHFAGMKGASI